MVVQEATTRPEAGAGPRLAATAFLCAFASTGVGFLIGGRWALPALNAFAIYPFYLNLILAGQRRRAVALALLWAIFSSEAMIGAAYLFPGRAEKVTLRGAEYRDEMFRWIRTGQGPESSPREFLPLHARELGLFAAAALVSGGLGALFLGAVLLNYMNFYVAALLSASAHPLFACVFAWQPYAMLRVVGYILVATAATEASFGAVARYRPSWRKVASYAAIGVALLVLDVIVKAAAAPAWARALRWSSGF